MLPLLETDSCNIAMGYRDSVVENNQVERKKVQSLKHWPS